MGGMCEIGFRRLPGWRAVLGGLGAARWYFKTLGAVFAASASAVALAACGSSVPSSSSASGPPQRGGTLTIATPLEPVSLDPALGGTDPGSQHVQTLIFNRLLEVQPGSLDLVPGLAESWKLNADQRSATFHLRAAKFSDGSPVTAEDVKFSFERAMSPKIDPNFGESLTNLIQSISTPNAHTVVLHFAGPRPAVFYYIAFAPLGIVNKHVFERLGAKRFATEPIGAGSGPFALVKWTKGQGVELKRNPNYWRIGLPYLAGVNMVHVPDDNTRLLDVRSGQVDASDEISYSQLNAIKNTPGVTLHLAPIAAVDGVLFRPASGPLKSAAVRQALNYATPKEVIKKIVFAGQGAIGNSGVMPPLHYWDPNVKPYPYDVAKAKQLLSEAGASGGFTLPLLITSGDEVSRQIATILQSAWSKIGVKLQVQTIEEATMGSRFLEGNYQAMLFPPTYWSSDIPSEDEFTINMASPAFGGHIMGVKDPKMNALAKQIEGTWNEETRRRLFAERQQEEMNYAVFAPTVVAESRTALRDNVEGFDYVAMNWLYLDRTWLKR
jgi:peptide/nickel transport system substrate-binding protein